MKHHSHKRDSGFTLIELLVVLGIIAILASIIIVAVSSASETARQARSTDALRQMANGYSQYTSDNDGKLMPGYTLPDDYSNAADMPFQLDAKVNGQQLGQEDAAGYVWRLAPYLADGYKTVMTDYRDEEVLSYMDSEVQNNIYGPGSMANGGIGVSLRPSFGLNSIALGGDSHHGGRATRYHPWGSQYANERFAATRMSEVAQKSRMILFAATHDPTADVPSLPGTKWGYVELRPPGVGEFIPTTAAEGEIAPNPWEIQQWWFDENGDIVDAGSGNLQTAGVPTSRGDKAGVPLVRLDGATGLEFTPLLANDAWSWMPFGPSKSRR